MSEVTIIGAKYARRIKRTEPFRLAVIAVGPVLTVVFFSSEVARNTVKTST